MRNLSILLVLLFTMAGVFAQQAKREIIVDPLLIERLGIEKVNELRANNPRQLIIENIELVRFSALSPKLGEIDDSYKMMGELSQYVKKGKTCNYQELISKGYVSRDDFNLEADATLTTVYTLGNTGYYLFVRSKAWLEEHKRAVIADYGL